MKTHTLSGVSLKRGFSCAVIAVVSAIGVVSMEASTGDFMAFNPKTEPCFVCGREVDECACGLAPDTLDLNALDELSEDDDFYSDWSFDLEAK